MINAREEILGSWCLVSYVQSFVDGRADVLPMGSAPEGVLVYTHDYYMSAQLGPAKRPVFASDVITDGVDEEYARAARTYIAYSGRYSIDEAAMTVTHHVEISLFPNWARGDQVRRMAVNADRLTLSSIRNAPGSRAGAIQTLIWRRALSK